MMVFMGCHRHGPAPELDIPSVEAEPIADLGHREVIPAGSRWSGGGLCLDIPADWDVLGAGDGVLGTLSHRASGVDITIIEYRQSDRLVRERDGFSLQFEDESAYRTIEVLSAGGTRTWTSTEPGGPTLKEWYGTVGNRRIHLEIVLPFGKIIQGTRAVEQLFAGLKMTC
jgi:hypothetical protein